jgi:transcriptional regulator with GAF, ATPase, and Fis domain
MSLPSSVPANSQECRVAVDAALTLVTEQLRAAEERADELARANESLRQITDRLGANEDLSEFLHAALGELCVAGGAISAGLFIYESADHTLRKVAFVWKGQSLDVNTDPRMTIWRASVAAAVTDCWARMLAGESPVWTDMTTPPEDQWNFALGWHEEMGHRMIAAFPLRVSGRPVGFLRLGFATAVRPTTSKLEQCRVLAQQAALALQMSRTAAKARTAAVAVEHERAARERLGELVAANRILVNSLDGFTVNSNPDEFLAKVLMQLTDVLAVPVVELWYARDLSGVVYPGPMYHAGRVWSAARWTIGGTSCGTIFLIIPMCLN